MGVRKGVRSYGKRLESTYSNLFIIHWQMGEDVRSYGYRLEGAYSNLVIIHWQMGEDAGVRKDDASCGKTLEGSQSNLFTNHGRMYHSGLGDRQVYGVMCSWTTGGWVRKLGG